MPISPQEEILSQAAVQGDLTAFTGLYEEYFDRVYRFLRSRIGSAPDAEELTAATFFAAMEAFPRYRHQGKFAAWLFSIARRKAADFYRKPRALPLAAADAVAADQDLLTHAVRKDQLERLNRRLATLSDSEREALSLRFGAGLTYPEMAEVLGKSEESVRKSVSRLCARLQKELE